MSTIPNAVLKPRKSGRDQSESGNVAAIALAYLG